MMKFKITFLTIVSTLILVSCATEPKEAPVVDFLTKNIIGSNVTVTGEVISTAGDDMTLRGFCWSTSPSPTKDDAVIIDTLKGLGTYTLSLPNLLGETEYYLRAFAENSFGVAYSGDVSFKTAYGMNSRGCIVCPASNPTDVIIVNGVEYTVVDSSALYNLVNIDADLSKICISKITNLSYYALEPKGDITTWDVSNVTDMTGLFASSANGLRNSFNQKIGNWDVSNVTRMGWMFEDCDFNQDIGDWDVSSVNDMRHMFSGATYFNQNIGSWDISNVVQIEGMFWQTTSASPMAFNQDIGNWDISNITNMQQMFRGATSFNQDIGNWDVSNVNNMNHMFNGASVFNQNLSQWCVSNLSVEPLDFSRNSSLTASNHPVWGTCP